jgi:hypothetical protein
LLSIPDAAASDPGFQTCCWQSYGVMTNFYLKVLAGRDDVLTPSQLVTIRQLATEGRDEQMIFEIVGARNVDQVKRVLAGKTYIRVL